VPESDVLTPMASAAVERLAYSVPEALHALGIGRTAFYQLVESGAIRTVKAGGRRLVPVAAIHAFLEDGATESTRGVSRREGHPLERADALEALVTAKEWTRAAIVHAFTQPGTGGPRRRQPAISDRLSFTAFAQLGIAGLRSDSTVGKYRAAWQDAIDAGEAKPIEPGDKVTGGRS
jgi:excisionase family DNA binding protein